MNCISKPGKLLVFATTLLALTATQATASVIVAFTGVANSAPNTLFIGQSLTTPSGTSWNNLSFNWFSDSAGTVSSAAGTLFLLTSAYTGTAAGLSSATPGFVAQSQSISSNVYLFAPSVAVQANAQYFFYSNTALLVNGANFDAYPGGIAYLNNPFVASPNNDAYFQLSGTTTATPEPGTFGVVFLASALICAAVASRRTATIHLH